MAYKKDNTNSSSWGKAMLYIERDNDGNIISLHNKPETDASEQKSIYPFPISAPSVFLRI
jgi:hypothetical protein